MGTSVQVTPLCGVYDENPLSYLVSVDGFNFLIDCGWNDHFDASILEPLSRVASTVDAVLLSHSDTLHMGALPYAYKKLGLSAPIFATEPVFRLGLLTMYDQYLSQKQVSEFELFTLDDIDSVFQSITRLTYSQNHHMSGKGEGIVIAPHVAGHLLGGTVWKITKDGEDVIYAVDFNHRKERHLNGTVLESFVRPAVLITDAYNALNNQPTRRKQDEEFLGEMEVLRVVDAKLVAYVHPSMCKSIPEAVLNHLSTLLFKFDEKFDGVVLAYDPDVGTKVGKIISGVHSYFGIPFKAKLLVFNPLPDMFVEGEVIKVSHRFIHVIVLGFAASTIAEEDIRGEFKYKNKSGQECFVSRSHKKHRIKVGTFLRFSVKSFDDDILHISGSMIPVQTGCKGWLESHSEKWSQLESTNKKRRTIGEIEDIATPRKETEEMMKNNGNDIFIGGSPNKKLKRRKKKEGKREHFL